MPTVKLFNRRDPDWQIRNYASNVSFGFVAGLYAPETTGLWRDRSASQLCWHRFSIIPDKAALFMILC